MEILLDTHAFIWFINGDNKLPSKPLKLIKKIENRCFVSIATIWEIAIKYSLGRLELTKNFDDILKIMLNNKFEILPITFEHIQKLIELEYIHRDPFDRIIISQGIVENLQILSKDENFKKYTDNIIWE